MPGTGPTELAALFAAKTGGRFHPLQAPAVADAGALRRAVRPTTEIFDRVTVALVGVGARTDGAGHILVHVFDDDGRIVSHERSIALSVAQLRRATVVAAAGGPPEASRGRRRTAHGPAGRPRHRRRLRAVRAAMTTAVVTGARGGIGSATVAALEHAGFAVHGVDIDDAFPSLDRIDALVCAHGISGRRQGDGPVDTCTDEGWDLVLDANLKSVFLYAKQAIPLLRHNGGGAIVTVARRCSASSAATRTSPRMRTRRRRPA